MTRKITVTLNGNSDFIFLKATTIACFAKDFSLLEEIEKYPTSTDPKLKLDAQAEIVGLMMRLLTEIAPGIEPYLTKYMDDGLKYYKPTEG